MKSFEKNDMKDKVTDKSLNQIIKTKETRKLKERRKSRRGIWYGLGMFGLIGWSVVVPTILGTMLGKWLDKRFPGKQSWTLTFLIIGIVAGCILAWHWLSREGKSIRKEEVNNE